MLIAVMIWAARYWHSASFGLYEDDYTRVPQALTMSVSDLRQEIVSALTTFSDHGKPLHSTLIYGLAFVGGKLGGLRGVYWVGYAIFTLNAWLFYGLLKRLYDNRIVALTGALAYCLFSADTTQAFLTHALGLQPSLTFLLLAMHAFLSGKKWLAYGLVIPVLFIYETPFPIFLAAPLLETKWDKAWLKRWVVHAVILGVMLAGVTGLRLLIGEGRVSELGAKDAVITPLIHMLIGPPVSLAMFVYRPIQALLALRWDAAIAIGLAIPLLAWILSRLKADTPLDGRTLGLAISKRSLTLFNSSEARLLRLAIAGLAMLILAYPLTFTVRAYAISGRDTRVHFAAVIGAAILAACVILVILSWAESRRKQWLAAAGVAIFFALLLGYGFVIQRDYVLGWQYQRDFWREALPLITDVSEGTVVLIDPDGFPDTEQIGANTWMVTRLLKQIYVFPQAWGHPPRVFRLAEGWQERILTADGLFQINGLTTNAPPSDVSVVESSDIILLKMRGGHLVRDAGSLVIDGQAYPLRPDKPGQLLLRERGPLYEVLLGEP